MSRLAKEILREAIQLPEKERVQVVERLIASLEPKSNEDVDAAWLAEIKRRSREVKEGSVSLNPWKEVGPSYRRLGFRGVRQTSR